MSDPFSSVSACGCCVGIGDAVLAALYNRPGLPRIAYRIGRHGSFKSSMLAAISRQESLYRLGTRRDDDFTIGLIDTWSVALDIVTFYQERLANEAFLRTAVQRRSLLELARLIGYRLGPGVAAEVLLAFTLDDTEGSPETVTIEAGTRAQSLPASQDELPQSFETSDELVAEARWNVLTPRRTVPQVFDRDTKAFYVRGVATGLRTGDPVLVVESDMPGMQVLRRVRSVEADATNDRTLIVCVGAGAELPSAGEDLETELFEPELTESEALAVAEAEGGRVLMARSLVSSAGRRLRSSTEDRDTVRAASTATTEAMTLEAGTTYGFEHLLEAELEGWTVQDMIQNILTRRDVPVESDLGLYALQVSSPPFGHNAPRYATLPTEWTGSGNAYATSWDDPNDDGIPEGWPVADSAATDTSNVAIQLAQARDEVQEGDWVALTNPSGDLECFHAYSVSTVSVADFSLSGEATRIELARPSGSDTLVALSDAEYNELGETFKLRETTIHSASKHLPFADLFVSELVDTMPAGTRALQIEEVVPNLEPGRRLILEGELADDPGVYGREELELAWVEQGVYTRLVFSTGVERAYKLSTVTILANVVPATHGESRTEVLGSGDGSEAFQRFTLAQAPLTHVSASSSGGTESTLRIEIDGIRWHERASLYDATPRDRVFVTRQRDDGITEIRFGDGRRGARLPSGGENVVAGYRVGIGSDGLVNAGQISLLARRPLGVKEVTNPLASSGAEDAETRDEARQNAPLTVLTLDRVVSLRDFEDFARAFGGIGKARADWVWNGTRRVVHLTIAAPGGAELSDTVREHFEEALDAAREPSQQVVINQCEQLYFSIALRLAIDPDHDWDTVTADVTSAITEAYSFTARDFAQRVAYSEVVALVQNVTGVVAVDLDALTELVTNEPADDLGLPARPARFDDDLEIILPAQLLTLAPATADPVTIVEMT